MRILFAGSPAIAVPVLEELFKLSRISPDYELAAILTNPDSPKGRSGVSLPTDVGAAAERLAAELAAAGKPAPLILKPVKLDTEVREKIAACSPDLLISFACGHFFGPKFLALFPSCGINIHPSLLPKYRGATPIPAAILAREKETGVSIQRLAAELDSGDILMQARVPLDGRETTASLTEIMAKKAADMLPGLLAGLATGAVRGTPQNHTEACYCTLLTKEDGRIDWNKSAKDIDAHVRAYDPWPQSWTRHGDQQLFILQAREMEQKTDIGAVQAGLVLGIDKQQGILVQTGEGLIAVSRLQYCAKKALDWKDFLNGTRNFIGSRLG